MKPVFIKYIFLALVVFCSSHIIMAQSTSPADTFPVPGRNAYQLFYLQRQPNSNTIIVALNVKKGKLDLDDPVHVYWIRYTEDGQTKELNWIQRTFAYGMQTKKISDGVYELNFVSYKKMKFSLELGTDKVWRVFANLKDGSEMIVRRIYLHVNGGSFWKPNVEYVELKGDQPVTYKEVRERISVK